MTAYLVTYAFHRDGEAFLGDSTLRLEGPLGVGDIDELRKRLIVQHGATSLTFTGLIQLSEPFNVVARIGALTQSLARPGRFWHR